MIDTNPREFRGLLDVQPGLWRVRGLGRECYPNLLRTRVDLDALKRSGIERQPQATCGNVNAHTERIERLDLDPGSIDLHVATERQPAKFRMIDDIGCSIESVAEEVRAVIAGIAIPLER